MMNDVAQQGGTQQQSEAVRMSLDKLRHRAEVAVRTLAQAEAEVSV